MTNLSQVCDVDTATTQFECAEQRAAHLGKCGIKKVLELCIGPSLHTLEKAYHKHGIDVVGNDIDVRWQRYYPKGKWLIGDALALPFNSLKFDAVVFAPPLSMGCTGKREDSLTIDQVNPTYDSFLEIAKEYNFAFTLVLPGRSLATKIDREQYFKLINKLYRDFPLRTIETHPLEAGTRGIVKYYDITVL